MKHVHYSDVELEEPSEDGIKDLKVRWLIKKKDGAKNFTMRLFELEPGGNSPFHKHDWEHQVFILEGSGTVAFPNGEKKPLKPWDVVWIPENEKHNFNAGENGLKSPLQEPGVIRNRGLVRGNLVGVFSNRIYVCLEFNHSRTDGIFH